MSQAQLLVAIFGLMLLELCHLKWIWLEYWNCRRCRVKNLDCACKPAWVKFL